MLFKTSSIWSNQTALAHTTTIGVTFMVTQVQRRNVFTPHLDPIVSVLGPFVSVLNPFLSVNVLFFLLKAFSESFVAADLIYAWRCSNQITFTWKTVISTRFKITEMIFLLTSLYCNRVVIKSSCIQLYIILYLIISNSDATLLRSVVFQSYLYEQYELDWRYNKRSCY